MNKKYFNEYIYKKKNHAIHPNSIDSFQFQKTLPISKLKYEFQAVFKYSLFLNILIKITVYYYILLYTLVLLEENCVNSFRE